MTSLGLVCPRPAPPYRYARARHGILSSSGTFSNYEDVTEENESAFAIEEVLSRTTINYQHWWTSGIGPVVADQWWTSGSGPVVAPV
ncbi:hypothetical protein BV898_01898 [Hypsibius exemplaris]|uniref:Uncharacterized protein n=1 Tax=Hypsibius exemplaris TaxID=2072580 RepID=A0A1W0XAC9_HYPEX|nr:hypothetical protein BV898_01898 [Hypsibius exemplaris]